MKRRIAIIGLGYVGLPVAVAFAEAFPGVIGFDISAGRIRALRDGNDRNGEIASERLRNCNLELTSDPTGLRGADVFIVCVPTPIYSDKRPDLRPLESASQTVGRAMAKGAIVVYESTVYPGITEEFCGPILAAASGLKQGAEFKLGYSPERINPGDRNHRFETIVKVVAAEDGATREIIASLYEEVVKAGVYRAASIRVAETAKALENTQRDLNIALMNELAIICDLAGICTKDVIEAASTKWNFLKFHPGLVGGHCIGVDPYYLTSKAQELGYHPEVILAGRRINDSMGKHIAQRIVQLLSSGKRALCDVRVGILGLTFKENVPDIRNSRVPDIVAGLKAFGISPLCHDPLASPAAIAREYGLDVSDRSEFADLDALILAVPHSAYLEDRTSLWSSLRKDGVLFDVRSALDPSKAPASVRYWGL